MNSQHASQANQAKWQEFIDAAKAKYAAATEAYNVAFSAANAHQSYVFFKNAQDAYNAAGAQWTADQHTANTMAQAEFDAATAQAPVIAVAYGADGEVLSYEQTVEAIANRQGWFDRQGRWVNYARMMQEARAMLATN